MTHKRRGRINRAKRQAASQERVNKGSRDPQHQIEALDARLGVGVGAAKERARLIRKIVIASGKNIPREEGSKWIEVKRSKS